jgi:energy-coupling factor transport system substrate-specific component
LKSINNINIREIALAATFCSIIYVARVAFYLIPARTLIGLMIITGMCLGPFFGFVIGIAVILISNVILGHGVWTLFQIFAASTIGFASGFFLKDRKYNNNRLILTTWCIFCMIIYAGANFACSFIMSGADNLGNFKTAFIYYLASRTLVKDVLSTVSTIIIVLFLSKPIEKITREYTI